MTEARSTQPRRSADCPDCDGAKCLYVGRGVRPCQCRPSPPPEELRSPPTPVEGLEREIALIAEKVKI